MKGAPRNRGALFCFFCASWFYSDTGRGPDSRVGNFELALAISGVCEAGEDVLLSEEWKFAEDIGVTHSASQVIQHVSYTVTRNPRMQGLPPRFPGSMVMISEYPTSQLYCEKRERTIKNAASIGGLMLTTEALVADVKEDDIGSGW
jgi:hypothetical protein